MLAGKLRKETFHASANEIAATQLVHVADIVQEADTVSKQTVRKLYHQAL